MTEQTQIPAHRHLVETRSAEPRFVEGGNDDRAAKPKTPRKPRKAKVTKTAAPASDTQA